MIPETSRILPPRPDVPAELVRKATRDFEKFAEAGLPSNLEAYLLEEHGLDVSANYAGLSLKNPWGLASGQLSMKVNQVETAANAGLGFVVLKTVIAEDEAGDRSMGEWAIKESRMVVEPIVGTRTGEKGWTVTWKGRGWWHSFDDYLSLVKESTRIGVDKGMRVVPSVKYHLPAAAGEPWRASEYESTTRRVLGSFLEGGGVRPMPIEKDFSPTLAGSERSAVRQLILEWLDRAPGLIRGSVKPGDVAVGLKLFNSLESDEFQLEMLDRIHREGPADFFIYANRLFDPGRVFDGHKGVAFGGPDLSDRNLRLLTALRSSQDAGIVPRTALGLSATGDIHSGRLAIEYALRGATSFQMHTLFQLPAEEFPMKRGDRIERAIHKLVFDPEEGFIVWAHHAAGRLGVADQRVVRLLDLAEAGRASALS